MRRYAASLFLLNPRAGARKGQPLSELIQQKADAAGLQYAIEPTRADSNYALLKEKLIAEQITDLIIAGGDGTISAVTAALREMPIRFGIIQEVRVMDWH
ncbi:MAG: acylglycerol kinase family protein [Flavobacteriales bacterium]|nr:acylglycerol kinase family protein [Flavobacteriales bacterium]